VEDEYATMKNTFDPATVYWWWLHVQVDHWEAVSILSNHATIPKNSMDISLLAVSYPDQHLQHDAMCSHGYMWLEHDW
jgi:hypothetical protein